MSRARAGELGEGGVVDLAAAQVGEGVDAEVGGGEHPGTARGDARRSRGALGQARPLESRGSVRGDDDDGIRRGEAPDVVTVGSQGALDVVEVDPVAQDLRGARPAAGDLEQAGIRDAAEVAGVQALDRAAPREVGRLVRVAEHDVRPGVDDLAVEDLEVAAGDGDTDGARVLGSQVGGQVRHPRGRLGLAVHDEQVPAALAPERGQLDDAGRVHPAAGLGDRAQVGEGHRGEPDAVEQVEGVGDTGQGRHLRVPGELPEALIGDREVGEHDRRPGDEVAVHDAQAVAVVQRQARHGSVTRADAEGAGDRLGVAAQVVVGEADQPRRAARAARAHEQGEVGVQGVGGVLAVDGHRAGPGGRRGAVVVRGDRDVGVPRLRDRRGGRARRGEQHDVTGRVGREVADEGVEVVGTVDVHQPTLTGEDAGPPRHPLGELGPGQRRQATVCAAHVHRRSRGVAVRPAEPPLETPRHGVPLGQRLSWARTEGSEVRLTYTTCGRVRCVPRPAAGRGVEARVSLRRTRRDAAAGGAARTARPARRPSARRAAGARGPGGRTGRRRRPPSPAG